MVNELVLRATLITLAEQNKSIFNLASSALTELVALRETVRALDPAFAEILEAQRKQAAKVAVPLISDNLERINEMIRLLNAGSVC